MNVISNLYPKTGIEKILCSAIAISGVIYLYKSLFKKRINKKFYNKDKKKHIRKFTQMFNDINKKVEVGDDETPGNENRVAKMKVYLEKLQQYEAKTPGQEVSYLDSRRDKIFFYIFNNVSNNIVQK
jgi:hypothetical protein